MTDQTLSQEQFAKWVRDAYNRLYDSPYLHQHPLADILLPAEPRALSHRSQNLRRVLHEAIESLRPKPGVPAQSPDWRIFRIIELRYVEGLSPAEAMEQLAVSKSQFFRDQADGLEHIIQTLWERRAAPSASAAPPSHEQAVQSETDRLFEVATWDMIKLDDVLADLMPVASTLARLKQATIEYTSFQSAPPVRADRVILRQALLNLVTYSISNASEKRVHIAPHSSENEAGLRFRFRFAPNPPDGLADSAETGLRLCSQLMSAVNGQFSIQDQADIRHITLAWPARAARVLLIVDDNQSLIELYRRYLAGQPWQVVGARNGAQARQILAESRPTVIMLDVMMPEEDGWEMLVSLKSIPELADIPIIICSVVNEPQLAISLGATSYLTKPVNQWALLHALAQWS